MELMDGAGATTANEKVAEFWPSGLVAFTVQLSAVVDTLMVICNCVLLTNATSADVRVFDPPVQVTNTVGLFTNPVPLSVIVCELFDPVTGFGETLVIVGAAAGAVTENGYEFELCPSGFTTCAVQFAAVVPTLT